MNLMLKKLTPWRTPLALLTFALLLYAPFLNKWGFYWDDWIFAWVRAQQGAAGLQADFATSRPLRGLTEPLLDVWLGLDPLRWQVWGLFTRWLAALTFWLALRAFWPQRRAEGFLAAALFLAYPGFGQQPLAMTYHYFWTFYAVFFLSLWLMARALQGDSPRWGLYVLSLAFAVLHLFASEYLIGLEMLRPLLLWFLFTSAPTLWKRLQKTALFQLPYLLIAGLYLYWRFILFDKLYSNPTYTPTLTVDASASLLQKVTTLFAQVGDALLWAHVKAWLPALQAPILTPLMLFLLLAIFLGGWWMLRRQTDFPARPAWGWLFGGLLATLTASLPFVAAGLPVRFIFPDDRFAIPFLMACAVFLTGLLSLRPGLLRWGGAFLLLLAANAQIHNNLAYAEEWSRQKSFLWQMTWRAPALRPQTIFLAEDADTFRFDDYEALWVMLSWTYAPENTSRNYPYPYHLISMRPDVIQSAPRALVLRYAPPACLHILDPQRDAPLFGLKTPTTGTLPLAARDALPLGDLALIESESPPTRPPAFLGAEPASGWCFFYQHAELARQRGDWPAVLQILQDANGLQPDDPFEYLPFVEALARADRLKEARVLTRSAIAANPLLTPVYCGLWQTLAKNLNEAGRAQAESMAQEIGICPPR
ncbi:MAG: hypothetical protein CO094_04430 [Anaerolineae bacterium CG_4_9_14_3_um_filter_57_17]|nr:MAG: hypothetical protein AUK01_02875 [Anaerolineae bacterium CG2_30_57_67]PJB67349.1 MAG: hypothetical protein CO094_04430 [Anaerolineae bacterium CG_4_9_14_3_um_filter_57_17]